MAGVIDTVVALLLICGAILSLLAALGFVRGANAFARIQAFAKAGSIGTVLVFVAAAIAGGEFALFMRAIAAAALVMIGAAYLAPLLAENDGASDFTDLRGS